MTENVQTRASVAPVVNSRVNQDIQTIRKDCDLLVNLATLVSSQHQESVRRAALYLAVLNSCTKDICLYETMPINANMSIPGFGIAGVPLNTFIHTLKNASIYQALDMTPNQDGTSTSIDYASIHTILRCMHSYTVPCETFVLPIMSRLVKDEWNHAVLVNDMRQYEFHVSMAVNTQDPTRPSEEQNIGVALFPKEWPVFRHTLQHLLAFQ